MDILSLIPKQLIPRFTTRAKNVISKSPEIAKEHPSIRISKQGVVKVSIEPEHLLYALFEEKGGMARNLLETHRIDRSTLTNAISQSLESKTDLVRVLKLNLSKTTPPKEKRQERLILSEPLKRVLKRAVVEASNNNSSYVGTEHLLLAILVQKNPILTKNKAADLTEHLHEMFANASKFSEGNPLFELSEITHEATDITPLENMGDNDSGDDSPSLNPGDDYKNSSPRVKMQKNENALDYFTDDLTRKAEQNELDPLIARDDIINRLVHILSRRTKNNPILVGPPGVGKTAIVEGISQKIAMGELPEHLLDKRILSLDLGLLVSGTVFRGEFEARLKDLFRELKESQTILFIDEIHSIIGAGSAQGSLDAADLLKPELSSGNIQCIGATTLEEYRKHFAKNRALERRFQPIFIEELNVKDSIEALKGLKHLYEKHHGISIPNDALKTAVELSTRYIKDRYLPDKAIDLIDEASSRLRHQDAKPGNMRKFKTLQNEFRALDSEKEEAIRQEHYEEALRLKERQRELTQRLRMSRIAPPKRKNSVKTKKLVLTSEHIRELVANLTGIPVQNLTLQEAKKFSLIEKKLSQHVKGQKEVLKDIASTLKRARAGISDPTRPLGSFLFLGPSGIGKTETARSLATLLSDNTNAARESTLIKLDMSEFSEPHSVSKLIGAPPGYIGFEDHTPVFERLKRNPYSVILFDEIEKAHPQLFNILLQMLEDGELTQANGEKINFANTIIVMTSNIGTEEFTKEGMRLGFSSQTPMERTEESEHINFSRSRLEEIKKHVMSELQKIMRPELLGRIDRITVFNPLGLKDIESIVKLKLHELKKRMPQYHVSWTPGAVEHLTKISFNPREGARLVRKNIETLIEDEISHRIISGDFNKKDSLIVDAKDDTLVITKKNRKK